MTVPRQARHKVASDCRGQEHLTYLGTWTKVGLPKHLSGSQGTYLPSLIPFSGDVGLPAKLNRVRLGQAAGYDPRHLFIWSLIRIRAVSSNGT